MSTRRCLNRFLLDAPALPEQVYPIDRRPEGLSAFPGHRTVRELLARRARHDQVGICQFAAVNIQDIALDELAGIGRLRLDVEAGHPPAGSEQALGPAA